MPETYNIIYDNPERGEHVHGIALPLFIHNFSYHLVTLDIYEDGVADCWELVALADLHQKVAEGWLATEPPEGERLSIHDVGQVCAADAQWAFPTAEIVSRSEEIFNRLNPGGKNLLDLAARRKQIAAADNQPPERIWLTRMRPEGSLYRLTPDGQEIRGAEVQVFTPQAGEFHLTSCFVYRDRHIQLGGEGELLPAEAVHDMLANGQLVTSVPDGAWITLPGLGRFRAVEGFWYVQPLERWREIANLLNVMNGGLDAVEACYQAFLAYNAEPTATNREQLRAAYEAVPEHHRLYTQRSMDNKDHDIRQILYGRKKRKK